MPEMDLTPEGIDLEAHLRGIERTLICQALFMTKGNKALAAKLLKINRTTLVMRVRRYGIGETAENSDAQPNPAA